MAYATGTGAGIVDLLDAIRVFAVSQGWTEEKWSSTGNGLLFLSKGNCHVALQGFTSNHNRGETGSFVPFTDYVIRGVVASSLDLGLNTFNGHPGTTNCVTSSTDGDAMHCNDLIGPYVDWHLFAPADGNAIHVIVQPQVGRYTHMSFGLLDPVGLSHSGVAYATGSRHIWWANSTSVTSSNVYCNRPNAVEHCLPFGYGQDNTSAGQTLLRPGNALPAGFNQDNMRHWRGQPYGSWAKGFSMANDQLSTTLASSSDGVFASRWRFAGPTVFGQRTPLLPIPAIVRGNTNSTIADNDSVSGVQVFLGMFPDVRLVNMTGLNDGQEIEYAGDIWKVFPVKKRGGTATLYNGPTPSYDCNTLDYGYAYKKVV